MEKEKEKTFKAKKQRKERSPVLPTQGSWGETERVGVEVDLLQREGTLSKLTKTLSCKLLVKQKEIPGVTTPPLQA